MSFRDKIRDWESIFTLAAFSFYRGGSIVPTLGMAVDPVNQWNMETFWAVDYVVRDDFVVNLAQRYFVTPRGTAPRSSRRGASAACSTGAPRRHCGSPISSEQRYC